MASTAIKVNRRMVLNNVTLSESTSNLLVFTHPLQHYITSLVNSHLIAKVEMMMPCLTRAVGTSHDHVFRLTCSLMSSRINAKVFRANDPWSMLMKNIFTSCCINHEVLCEFVTSFVANGMHREARNEYNTVWKKRNMMFVTVNMLEQISMSCVALADFLDCLDDLNSSAQSQSSQHADMVLDQVQNIWKAVLTNDRGPLDFLIPRILDIYIHKDEIDEALECLITYKKLNSDNLNAYVYIFKFLVKYGDRNEEMERTIEDCFHEIVKLSPGSPLILEMLDYCDVDSRYICNILMDFVDYTSNKNNSDAWKKLHTHLEKVNSEEMDAIRDHYESFYASYWPEYHWKSSKSDQSFELKEWKEKVEYIITQKQVPSKKNTRRSRSSSLSSGQKISSLSKAKKPKLQPKHEMECGV